MIFGCDFLAGVKFPRMAVNSSVKAKGGFLTEFGKNDTYWYNLAESSDVLRIQGVWSDNHTFGMTERKQAIMGAKFAEKLQLDIPKCKIFYSPYCEHRKSAEIMRGVMEACYERAPKVELVNSPIKGGSYLKGYINEVHYLGGMPKPAGRYFFSFDGAHCVDMDVTKAKEKYADAELFFWWVSQFNLRKDEDDNTPRPQRKAKPTTELIESVEWLSKDKGAAYMHGTNLYKSHAEQVNNTPSLRENKPLVISPHKFEEGLKLVTISGTTIARAYYDQPYTGGGHIYRFNDWGYRYAKAARGELCKIIGAKDVVLGVVNPAFREGYYR